MMVTSVFVGHIKAAPLLAPADHLAPITGYVESVAGSRITPDRSLL